MSEYISTDLKDKSWYNLNKRISEQQATPADSRPLLVKRKGTSWHKLNKQIASREFTVNEYNGKIAKHKHKEENANETLGLRELKRLLKSKRKREHKQAHTQALERERKRIHRCSPDMHKNISRQRYYLYEGILYPKVNGKIPAKRVKAFT